MKKMLAMALTTILALTAVMCGGALAAGSAAEPVDVSNTQVDYQNGTYWARIQTRSRTTDTLQRICMRRTFTRLTRSGPCRPGTR